MVFMKIILVTLIALFVVSCSSVDYTKKREIEFNCIQNVEMFVLDAPTLFKNYGYDFKIVNINKGKFEASKLIKIDNKNVELLFKIELDDDDKEMEIKPSAKIMNSNEQVIQYFDENCYPKEYESHFIELIDNLKINCNKVSFPNKP